VKKKPVYRSLPHKPKRIILPAPDNLTSEQLRQWQEQEEAAPESWRHNNFFILYKREDQDSIVADLNGKTFLRHRGPIEEVFALVNALQAAKWQNRRVYEENFEDLSDDEFVDEGMMVLDDIMAVADSPLPDLSELQNLTTMLESSFLADLIKPPKKKK
jgi:hypothetical protein